MFINRIFNLVRKMTIFSMFKSLITHLKLMTIKKTLKSLKGSEEVYRHLAEHVNR